jgi:hypothetical protein
MALTVSCDAGFSGNPTFESARSRGAIFYLGRLTGTVSAAAVCTLTMPFGTPYFVSIPPASGYMFTYNIGTSVLKILVPPTSTVSYFEIPCTTIDLSCFTSFWNGTTSCGLPFIAVGWG